MLVANVRISKGSKTLHGWYIHPIPYEMSIKDFFDKLVTSEISPECNISINSLEIIDRIELSQTLGATAIQTSHSCGIIELTKTFGVNIHYILKPNDNITSPVSCQNAFEMIMQKKQI